MVMELKMSNSLLTFFLGGEDVECLQLEMSGFLKELACPYSTLVSGEIKDRLKKKEDCLKVLCKLVSSLLQYYILLALFPEFFQKKKNSTFSESCFIEDLTASVQRKGHKAGDRIFIYF